MMKDYAVIPKVDQIKNMKDDENMKLIEVLKCMYPDQLLEIYVMRESLNVYISNNYAIHGLKEYHDYIVKTIEVSKDKTVLKNTIRILVVKE